MKKLFPLLILFSFNAYAGKGIMAGGCYPIEDLPDSLLDGSNTSENIRNHEHMRHSLTHQSEQCDNGYRKLSKEIQALIDTKRGEGFTDQIKTTYITGLKTLSYCKKCRTKYFRDIPQIDRLRDKIIIAGITLSLKRAPQDELDKAVSVLTEEAEYDKYQVQLMSQSLRD